MVAQIGWRHLFAAWGIVTVIAVVALGVSGLPSVFDFAHGARVSDGLFNPRHEPAAHTAPSDASDPFYDETEINHPRPGQR